MCEEIMDKIPILVLAFNRADHVSRAMEAIRMYQPERLYLECDGARSHKSGEKEAVKATRKAMLDAIDWPCEVKTLFREENLGCAHAVNDAISWFFQHEEWGVIIEDDVIVGKDFFKLCEDLLPRYKNEERIMEISARNHSRRKDIDNSYVYAQCYHCWGWATWKRAWERMDMTMAAANQLSIPYLVKRLGWVRGLMMKYYFMSAYKKLDTFNSWATRWYLSILAHDGLVICPGVNLAVNIGMDGGAHYEKDDKDPYADLEVGEIAWPLVYNDTFIPDRVQKHYDNKDFLHVRILGGVRKYQGLSKKIKSVRSDRNRPRGEGTALFFVRYLFNSIRTWWLFHFRYPWVQYGGFIRVMRGTSFAKMDIKLGNNVQFGQYCDIATDCVIGNNVLFAGLVRLVGRRDHTFDEVEKTIWEGERGNSGITVIEDDVWIGNGSIVIGGLKIGAGSVVAAGSVVTKDIPPCEIWGGIPAKKIRDRFEGKDKERHLRFLRHNILQEKKC